MNEHPIFVNQISVALSRSTADWVCASSIPVSWFFTGDHHRVTFEGQTFLFISASVLSDNLPKSPIKLRDVPSCTTINRTGESQLIWWTIHLCRDWISLQPKLPTYGHSNMNIWGSGNSVLGLGDYRVVDPPENPVCMRIPVECTPVP